METICDSPIKNFSFTQDFATSLRDTLVKETNFGFNAYYENSKLKYHMTIMFRFLEATTRAVSRSGMLLQFDEERTHS